MKYVDARKLHNEDEVTVKETGEVLTVIDAYQPDENVKVILVECDDGNTYHHRDIK